GRIGGGARKGGRLELVALLDAAGTRLPWDALALREVLRDLDDLVRAPPNPELLARAGSALRPSDPVLAAAALDLAARRLEQDPASQRRALAVFEEAALVAREARPVAPPSRPFEHLWIMIVSRRIPTHE